MVRLSAALPVAALLAAVPVAAQVAGDSAAESLPLVDETDVHAEPEYPFGETVDLPITTLEVPSPVVTVDQEALFSQSAWGKRVLGEIEERSRQLAEENDAIESELVAEERALTDLRPEMEPDAFRVKAEEFDSKVQSLRKAQEAKRRELSAFLETERERFYAAIISILGDVVAERGAVAILDRRAIVLSVADIDITSDAVRRIDEEFGDGADR